MVPTEVVAVPGSESYEIVPIAVSTISCAELRTGIKEVFVVPGADSYETALQRPLLFQVRRAIGKVAIEVSAISGLERY